MIYNPYTTYDEDTINAIERIKELDGQIKKEDRKGLGVTSKRTKLMMEQLLNGIKLPYNSI